MLLSVLIIKFYLRKIYMPWISCFSTYKKEKHKKIAYCFPLLYKNLLKTIENNKKQLCMQLNCKVYMSFFFIWDCVILWIIHVTKRNLEQRIHINACQFSFYLFSVTFSHNWFFFCFTFQNRQTFFCFVHFGQH